MFVTRGRPFAGLIGALTVAAVAVSGCAAGQDAQTVEQTSVVDGTAFQAGQVDLRDVGLAPPTGTSYAKGGTAFLEGLIVNKASTEDRLVSITSPVASQVVFFGNQTDAVLAVGSAAAGASASGSPTTGGTDSTGPASSPIGTGSPSNGTPSVASGGSGTPSGTPGSSSASSSPSSTATSTTSGPSALSDVPLPSQQSVQFGYQSSQLAIVFVGLTEDLFPSQPVQLTFTFASGGTVTAIVQVKLPVGSSIDAPTVDTTPSE